MANYQLSSWDLSEIKIKNIPETVRKIGKLTAALESKKHLLTESIPADTFLSFVKGLELLKKEVNVWLGAYAQLKFAENSGDEDASALCSRIKTIATKIDNRLLFFELWFKNLPEGKAKELITASGKYHYFLECLRKTKPYTLKENEEKIINIKDAHGSSSLNSVYSIFTSQFEFVFAGKKLNQNELLVYVRDFSAEKREAAYRALLEKYKQNKDVIGEIYRSLLDDWREECVGLRGYKNAVSVRNVDNDIPDKAVEMLLNACRKNQHLFQKFFEIKRKKLKLRKMRRFDLYAPYGKEDNNISYNEAVNTVLDSFRRFSPIFNKEALNIIKTKHIHSRLQKNKNPGAFCSAVSAALNPYILLNYTGTLRDVSTLAHELGHGLHYNLAGKQSEFTFSAALPLAETASIFSEMLLSEYLQEKEPEKSKELLFAKLDEFYASIIRQAGFVDFEIKAHKMVEEGKTIKEISNVYLADLRKQLGNKIVVDDIFAYEWCYIPHIFHTPFYCYAYAFGNLLALALYEMYKCGKRKEKEKENEKRKEKGKEFASKIIELLSKGGSESPLEITKAVGVDICSEEFWQKGFDAIGKMVEEVSD
ncbi:MAG: M3 family oligoendopeptidase [Nanoarchaeota archaeon]